MQSREGLHQLEDFTVAHGEYISTINTLFHGFHIHECPPGGQGIITLMILNIPQHFKPKGAPFDIDRLHIEIEATRLACAARAALLADGDIPVDYLLSNGSAEKLAAKIDGRPALPTLPSFDEAVHHDTVYISVVDRQRNTVKFYQFHLPSYGSGLMAPKTGVLLHNRGQSFSLKRDHPNAMEPAGALCTQLSPPWRPKTIGCRYHLA